MDEQQKCELCGPCRPVREWIVAEMTIDEALQRLARLEQEDRTRYRNIIESAERCKRIAAQATHPEKANYYQSEAERDELHALRALADAIALALAQQALREWVQARTPKLLGGRP